MKIRTLAAMAATLLALTACSSGTTPQVTNSNSPSTPLAGGNFCESYDAVRALGTASTEAQAAYDAARAASTNPATDPVVLDALHAMGAATKADLEETVTFLRAASDATDRQDLKDAIATVVSLTEDSSIPLAEAAMVATDSTTYANPILATFAEGELEALLTEAADAATVIDDYGGANCNAW